MVAVTWPLVLVSLFKQFYRLEDFHKNFVAQPVIQVEVSISTHQAILAHCHCFFHVSNDQPDTSVPIVKSLAVATTRCNALVIFVKILCDPAAPIRSRDLGYMCRPR